MTGEYNHHVLAKTASDKLLEHWRNNEWSNEIVSEKVIATQSQSSFPSPDATGIRCETILPEKRFP